MSGPRLGGAGLRGPAGPGGGLSESRPGRLALYVNSVGSAALAPRLSRRPALEVSRKEVAAGSPWASAKERAKPAAGAETPEALVGAGPGFR